MICCINNDTIDELNSYVIICKENRIEREYVFISLNLSFININYKIKCTHTLSNNC